jgi:signal transduction histidine kinase/CheY-like chemotaxis protein
MESMPSSPHELDPGVATASAVTAALPFAACLIATDDTLLACNAKAETLFGVTPGNAVGGPFRDLDVSYRVPGLRAAVERVKAGGRAEQLADVSPSDASAGIVVGLSVAPIGDEGRVVAVLVCAEDRSDVAAMTAQVQILAEELHTTTEHMQQSNEELHTANEELLSMNDELEERVAELRDAAEASRHKDDFLAMLAHELRNPLAPIVSAMHVLRLHPEDGRLVQHAREVVERQVAHQARLLDDLLDVSRITRGKIELRKATVDVAVVVADAVETARPLIDERRHTLSVQLPEGPLHVHADATRVGQVIANLLNNAAKFTDPGGTINVTVAADGSDAVVRVGDNGHGIPADMQPQVFDLFTQVDPSLARSQGGLGIGLTLVRSLVEMHGGRVEVRSEGRGRGTEFTVRLPLERGTDEPVATHRAPAAAKARHIVIIEDNADARDMLSVSLELEGHRVESAADGLRGVEMALASRPDVVLVDIGLPGLDGYGVAARLRIGLGRDVVLIALTGYGQPDDRERTRQAGFDAHVVKPVDPDTLIRLLAEDFKPRA